MKLRRMSGHGDELLAEWEVETATPARLAEIEAEFKSLMARGYFAADLATNELIKEFKADTSILMIPHMQGG